MAQEVWDLFDKDYKFVRKFVAGKGSVIPDDLYHKCVEVIPTDMEGHLLVTQRAMKKRSAPGLWEFPAGSVLAGESEEAASVRELKEETGLRPKKLYFIQRARMRGVIRYIYIAYIPELTTALLNLPPDEVMDARLINYDEWMALVTTSDYNHFRTNAYNIKFYETLKVIVNKYADEAQLTTSENVSQKPFVRSNGLKNKKPKHLDKRCYEENETYPLGYEDWEPPVEQGDDGT